MSYNLNFLVSPLITPIVVPYIIPYITPFREFRLWLIYSANHDLDVELFKRGSPYEFGHGILPGNTLGTMGMSI